MFDNSQFVFLGFLIFLDKQREEQQQRRAGKDDLYTISLFQESIAADSKQRKDIIFVACVSNIIIFSNR